MPLIKKIAYTSILALIIWPNLSFAEYTPVEYYPVRTYDTKQNTTANVNVVVAYVYGVLTPQFCVIVSTVELARNTLLAISIPVPKNISRYVSPFVPGFGLQRYRVKFSIL